MTVKWYGEVVRARLDAEMTRRINAACILLKNHAKTLLSVAGTGVLVGTREPGRINRTRRKHAQKSVARFKKPSQKRRRRK